MAASEDEFILETLLNGCFSQWQLQIFIYFRNSYTYFTFLKFDVMLRRNEFLFFSNKSFGAKCKLHTELSLNFIPKQYFS